jgi:hypothetical protein
MSGKHKHVYNILTMARICLSLYIIHRVSSRSNKILMTSYVSFFFILIVFDRAEQTIHFFLIVFDMQWPTRGDEQRRSELTGPWRNDFDIGWGQIMQSWAFVERLRYRHVYTEQILSYLKNSLWHHLSVSGRIWSVWDELGLGQTEDASADMMQIWRWYGWSQQLHEDNTGSFALFSAKVTTPANSYRIPVNLQSALQLSNFRSKGLGRNKCS